MYATNAANLARSQAERSAASKRRRLEAAEHVSELLGQMKGPEMKVGQMASMMDFNRLPSGELDGFQARLDDLRDSAPQVPFKDIQKVIERELGERLYVFVPTRRSGGGVLPPGARPTGGVAATSTARDQPAATGAPMMGARARAPLA